MSSIVDIDLVEIQTAGSSGWLLLVFEVVFAGEACCRSDVLVAPGLVAGEADDPVLADGRVAALARDSLLELLETDYGPVSLQIELRPEGREVRSAGRPGIATA